MRPASNTLRRSSNLGPNERDASADDSSPCRLRVLGHGDLDDATIQAWLALEERALEPNAFLSPLFVRPAVRGLVTPELARGLRFVLIERDSDEAARLVGIAVLEDAPPSRGFPLRHVRAFRSVHSYLSGFLLDRDHAADGARALFAGLRRASWARHGLAVDEYPAEGPQAEIVRRAAEASGFRWFEGQRSRRATLSPASQAGEEFLNVHLSGQRRKKIRRSRRLLEEEGPVLWRLVGGAEVDDACIERFLEVEHDGWKGEGATSLLSNEARAAFARETLRSFAAAGRLFLTELLVGDEVVASTTNFVAGGAGFAFKVGWAARFARAGPGLLNEFDFVRHAPSACAGLAWIDSGAAEGSYIETLWAGRRELVRGTFARTPLGRLAAIAVRSLRASRGRWRRRVSSAAPPTD